MCGGQGGGKQVFAICTDSDLISEIVQRKADHGDWGHSPACEGDEKLVGGSVLAAPSPVGACSEAGRSEMARSTMRLMSPPM